MIITYLEQAVALHDAFFTFEQRQKGVFGMHKHFSLTMVLGCIFTGIFQIQDLK